MRIPYSDSRSMGAAFVKSTATPKHMTNTGLRQWKTNYTPRLTFINQQANHDQTFHKISTITPNGYLETPKQLLWEHQVKFEYTLLELLQILHAITDVLWHHVFTTGYLNVVSRNLYNEILHITVYWHHFSHHFAFAILSWTQTSM